MRVPRGDAGIAPHRDDRDETEDRGIIRA